MSLFRQKKQEEQIQKKVKDLTYSKANKKCFDCPNKNPSFVNTTIHTFICGRCSGLIREVGHRVKSISANKFTGPEYIALKHGGNSVGHKIWTTGCPDYEIKNEQDVRYVMLLKYKQVQWLNRDLLQSHTNKVKLIISKSFTEDGRPVVVHKPKSYFAGFIRIPNKAPREEDITFSTLYEAPAMDSDQSSIESTSSCNSSVRTLEDSKESIFDIMNRNKNAILEGNTPTHYVTPNKAWKNDTFNKIIEDLAGLRMDLPSIRSSRNQPARKLNPYDPYSSLRKTSDHSMIIQPPHVVKSVNIQQKCYQSGVDLYTNEPLYNRY